MQKGLNCLDEGFHLDLKIKILGLKESILETLGTPDPILSQELAGLVRYTGYGRGMRAFQRKSIGKKMIRLGDDPMGDFVDGIRDDGASKITKVEQAIKQGYFAFLPEILNLKLGSKDLVIDPIPGMILLVDKGNLRLFRRGMTPAMRSCFRA